jgi:hypothetical protein
MPACCGLATVVYDHGIMSDNNFCPPAKERDGAAFGYDDFWATIATQFGQQFGDFGELIQLGQEMIVVADEKATQPVERLVCDFVRVAMTGACEVIVLCGNGCGMGAMKVVRGMYETQWIAEYLRQNPDKAADYIEFSKVLVRRELDWLTENDPVAIGRVSPERTQEIESNYQQVRGQFIDGRGKERRLWSDKSLRDIAKSIGREGEYDVPYTSACDIHHLSIKGLGEYFVQREGEFQFEPPPSTHWVRKALIAAYANLLQILNTLNDCCDLGRGAQVENATHRLSAWQGSVTPSAPVEAGGNNG